MIGRLIIGEEVVATLGDDVVWSAPSSAVASYLNLVFGREETSPSQGIRGREQVIEAAADLGADYELAVLPDEVLELDGVVY